MIYDIWNALLLLSDLYVSISKYTRPRRQLQINRRVWRSCLIIETENSKNPTTCSTRYTRTGIIRWLYISCILKQNNNWILIYWYQLYVIEFNTTVRQTIHHRRRRLRSSRNARHCSVCTVGPRREVRENGFSGHFTGKPPARLVHTTTTALKNNTCCGGTYNNM